MKLILRRVFYSKPVNQLIIKFIRPFRSFIPVKNQFPIHGTFKVKGKNIESFKMTTNPTNAVTKFLYWRNIEGFEYSSVKIFIELIKTSRIFFDVGSNIGYYSLLASSIRKKQIEVYAFEPMPSIFDYLKKNIVLNNYKNINPINLALSNENGTATFYSILNLKFKELPQLTGDGGLSAEHSGISSKIRFNVNTITLDDFVLKNLGNKKIDLIKLDVEANEQKVLMGADKVLSIHRPIIQCEILKNQIEIELLDVLKKYDYLYFRCTDNGLLLVDSFLNNTSTFVDYYLVPSELLEKVKAFMV